MVGITAGGVVLGGLARVKANEMMAASRQQKALAEIKQKEGSLNRRDASLIYRKTKLDDLEVAMAAREKELSIDESNFKKKRDSFEKYRREALVAADLVGSRLFLKVPHPKSGATQWFTQRFDGQYQWYEDDLKKVYAEAKPEKRQEGELVEFKCWRINPVADGVAKREWVWVPESEMHKTAPEPLDWQ